MEQKNLQQKAKSLKKIVEEKWSNKFFNNIEQIRYIRDNLQERISLTIHRFGSLRNDIKPHPDKIDYLFKDITKLISELVKYAVFVEIWNESKAEKFSATEILEDNQYWLELLSMKSEVEKFKTKMNDENRIFESNRTSSDEKAEDNQSGSVQNRQIEESGRFTIANVFVFWQDLAHIPVFDGEPENFFDFIVPFNRIIHEAELPLNRKWIALHQLLGPNEQWQVIIGKDENSYYEAYESLVQRFTEPWMIRAAIEKKLSELTMVTDINDRDHFKINLAQIMKLYHLALRFGSNLSYLEGEFYQNIIKKFSPEINNQIFDSITGEGFPDVHKYCKRLPLKLKQIEAMRLMLGRELRSDEEKKQQPRQEKKEVISKKTIGEDQSRKQFFKQKETSKINSRTIQSMPNISLNPCIFCGAFDHRSYQCIQTDAKEKLDLILDRKRCLKCFSDSHQSNNCKFYNCQNCKGEHSKALCSAISQMPSTSQMNNNHETKQ
ncbi:hypothetical protein SSS_01033 [Sarcoptes scabiei]|uniref:Uncharacterized protein n=1 Tax=Sarcoptes scabiei TaxID=52283 RepID=A0A834R6Q2_SARSC|nr:hypothetical protein SSS_01033 [Sarcoptes scabiei]